MTDTAPAPTVRLTELTTCGGCAAKWGASGLRELLAEWRQGPEPEALLVGLADFDDAAVLEVGDGLALVSTVDFFPPLVDDPDDYGAIAAANACSDVFAMGGDVVLALSVAGFPEDLAPAVIARIVAAAAATVREAGGVLAGGHTIRAPEPLFGLAVQGLVRPGDQFTKGGARPGDVLVLSKPLGTGLALASGDERSARAAIAGMRRLNRGAAAALRAASRQGDGSVAPGRSAADGDLVHAVTDVTGFGLAGHGWEMAERSSVRLEFEGAALPAYPGVLAAAERGVRTGGDPRNRAYLGDHLASSAGEAAAALAFDPQTSGGLLAAVDPTAVRPLSAAGYVPIGRVEDGPAAVVLR
jgi:selenide, water dikinase